MWQCWDRVETKLKQSCVIHRTPNLYNLAVQTWDYRRHLNERSTNVLDSRKLDVQSHKGDDINDINDGIFSFLTLPSNYAFLTLTFLQNLPNGTNFQGFLHFNCQKLDFPKCLENLVKYDQPHYSKSQIFGQKIQFWPNPNIFTSFSPKFFLTIFLVKSKLSTAKKPNTTAFSRVFHPKKLTIFSGDQSWILGQKMKISNSVTKEDCRETGQFHIIFPKLCMLYLFNINVFLFSL